MFLQIPVIFDLSVEVRLKENKRSKRYDFKHANFESLKQTLLLIPLSNGIDNLNLQEDFDSLWDSWNDFVFAALKTQYCPLLIARLRSLAAIFLMLKNRKISVGR